ncbi:hypothetical protein K7G98_23230 [Saccharothrix sp. MB29]|nr:hypothetical protein [Saccharothrix sp. MB29]
MGGPGAGPPRRIAYWRGAAASRPPPKRGWTAPDERAPRRAARFIG